jgi:hypothetical protein
VSMTARCALSAVGYRPSISWWRRFTLNMGEDLLSTYDNRPVVRAGAVRLTRSRAVVDRPHPYGNTMSASIARIASFPVVADCHRRSDCPRRAGYLQWQQLGGDIPPSRSRRTRSSADRKKWSAPSR